MTIAQWEAWYNKVIGLCLESASASAPVIFYQTDRKHSGQWQSKVALIVRAAERFAARLLWHKIVLRRGVGSVDPYRPGFSNLVAISRKASSGKATPDVIPMGVQSYKNAMGDEAARLAVKFCAESASQIVDPFCGRGIVPCTAEQLGLVGIGIDSDPQQCELARKLRPGV